MAEVSVFARMTGKNRHFRDLSQQVLSGVVGRLVASLQALQLLVIELLKTNKLGLYPV